MHGARATSSQGHCIAKLRRAPTSHDESDRSHVTGKIGHHNELQIEHLGHGLNIDAGIVDRNQGEQVTGEQLRADIERRIPHLVLLVFALPGLIASHGSNEAAAAMLACGVMGLATVARTPRIARMSARARGAHRHDQLSPGV